MNAPILARPHSRAAYQERLTRCLAAYPSKSHSYTDDDIATMREVAADLRMLAEEIAEEIEAEADYADTGHLA